MWCVCVPGLISHVLHQPRGEERRGKAKRELKRHGRSAHVHQQSRPGTRRSSGQSPGHPSAPSTPPSCVSSLTHGELPQWWNGGGVGTPFPLNAGECHLQMPLPPFYK